jgi:uncharacterized protein YbcC (UPF0753/DUF2309 family)
MHEWGNKVETDRKSLQAALKEVRRLLPIQNPLHAFIHNNVLMQWENQPFWKAVEEAASLYRAKPYREFKFYTQAYQLGRIQKAAFDQACESFFQKKDLWFSASKVSQEAEFLSTILLRLGSDFFSNLSQPAKTPEEFYTFLLEKNPSLTHWCQRETHTPKQNKSHRLLAEPKPGTDCYAGLFEISRLIESFMDQGVSPWTNPFIENGFVAYASAYFSSKKWVAFPWQKRLATQLRTVEKLDTETALYHVLSRFHCPKENWQDLLLETAFLLKGWAGIINRLEIDSCLAPVRPTSISLSELLVVELLLLHSCHVKVHLPEDFPTEKKMPNQPAFSFLLHQFNLSYGKSEFFEWGWNLKT